ncbi:hypothetical protein H311_01391, partial [Anncaliia algerae PRA109]
ESDTGRIHMEIVENRSSATMINLFKKYIHTGTKVITDGFKSYPQAVSSINGQHIVVNHSIGFKNQDGFHINNIENLWSILKYKIKRRRGVLMSNIDIFLITFIIKYNFLRNRTRIQIFDTWNILIDYLFTNN